MDRPLRRSGLVALVAALSAVAVLAGCGNNAKPTETTTSHSVEPTSKNAKPGGPNNFSPSPIAPLPSTVSGGPGGGNPRP